MAQVKIAAKFSKDEQPNNGLTEPEHVAELITEPRETRFAVVEYTTLRVSDEIEDGTKVPTVKIHAFEPMVTPARIAAARALRAEQYAERTGHDPQLELDFGQPGPDGAGEGEDDGEGERRVPEAGAEEILAERAERKAAGQPAFSDGGEGGAA